MSDQAMKVDYPIEGDLGEVAVFEHPVRLGEHQQQDEWKMRKLQRIELPADWHLICTCPVERVVELRKLVATSSGYDRRKEYETELKTVRTLAYIMGRPKEPVIAELREELAEQRSATHHERSEMWKCKEAMGKATEALEALKKKFDEQAEELARSIEEHGRVKGDLGGLSLQLRHARREIEKAKRHFGAKAWEEATGG